MPGAERTLAAFAALLPEGSPERTRVEKLLSQLWTRDQEHPRDISFVYEALDRAEMLAAEGKRTEARSIWNGVIALYADDPNAETAVERARLNVANLKNATPTVAPKSTPAPTATVPPPQPSTPAPASKPAPSKPSGQGSP